MTTTNVTMANQTLTDSSTSIDTTADASSISLPPLPPSLLHTSNPPTLLTQGAEALLFRSTYLFPHLPCALKYRPSKPYRHPILDARLTKHRILSEARVLVKCRREGVQVPAVYAVDERKGWVMMEWIEGQVVRIKVNEWLKGRKEEKTQSVEEGSVLQEGQLGHVDELVGLLGRIGSAVGRLHAAGVVHGDLTTSNLMLRPWATEEGHEQADGQLRIGNELDGEIVLIDFGLASQSSSDEDRAVDLYVLERAFGSTHPSAEDLFGEVLKTYGKSFKGANVVLRKLEDVRMRGRKRSMIG